MGFAIDGPERFDKFTLVGRRETPISRWPCPPGAGDEAHWLLVGFMTAGGDEVAVYGRLKKDLRQHAEWANQLAAMVSDALTAHAERAFGKAQIQTFLESLLAEITS